MIGLKNNTHLKSRETLPLRTIIIKRNNLANFRNQIAMQYDIEVAENFRLNKLSLLNDTDIYRLQFSFYLIFSFSVHYRDRDMRLEWSESDTVRWAWISTYCQWIFFLIVLTRVLK